MRAGTAIALTAVVVASALGATVLAEAQSSPPPFVLIGHPTVSATSVDRKFVEDAFLKKITRWPDGELIRPVDLAADSLVRRKFTEDVLDRSVAAVKGYWQQRIFSGRDVPPPEVDDDEQVVRYVLKHDGAIGYVSGSAAVGDSRILGVK